LNLKLFKRFILLSKIQRNEEKAIKFFFGNLVKCESKNSNYLKEKFINIFRFNENLSLSLNINSFKIMNLKTIYRLTLIQKITKEELIENLSKDKFNIFSKKNSEDNIIESKIYN
jgi:hypothetical protein